MPFGERRCKPTYIPLDQQEHPKFLATRSRANRLASSTTTVRTPLPSIRSISAAKPGRTSMGWTFEDDDHARRCEGRAMPQFGNSGDKIGQTVAVARYIVQRGSFSATSGLFGRN